MAELDLSGVAATGRAIDTANFQSAELSIEGDKPLQCLFNPREYTITKSTNWTPQGNSQGIPSVQYTGGAPRELSFEILLDDFEGEREIQSDIDRLFRAMEATKPGPSAKLEPPQVTFTWGAKLSFEAGLKSLSAQYVRFHPNGQPSRALLRLTLVEQASEVEGQNPTTRALPARGVHTMRDGDTLQSIAFAAFGDPNAWRAIAEANGVDDPLAVRSGVRLTIPNLRP